MGELYIYFPKESCNKGGGQFSSSGIWVAEVTFKAKSERRLVDLKSEYQQKAAMLWGSRGEGTCCAQQSPSSRPPSPGTTPGSAWAFRWFQPTAFGAEDSDLRGQRKVLPAVPYTNFWMTELRSVIKRLCFSVTKFGVVCCTVIVYVYIHKIFHRALFHRAINLDRLWRVRQETESRKEFSL